MIQVKLLMNRAIQSAAALALICRASFTIFHAIPAYWTPHNSEVMLVAWPSEAQYLKIAGREATKLLARAHALAVKQGVAAATMQAPNADTPWRSSLRQARPGPTSS